MGAFAMGGIGGGGGAATDGSIAFVDSSSSALFSLFSESVCVSTDFVSVGFGKTIGSTSMTVALSTKRFAVFEGELSIHFLHRAPLEVLLTGEDVDETESAELFLRRRRVGVDANPPVGVLGVVLDLSGLRTGVRGALRTGDVFITGVSLFWLILFTMVLSELSKLLPKIVESDPFNIEFDRVATPPPLFVLDSDDCIAYSLRKLRISISVSCTVSHLLSLFFSSAILLF